MLRENHGDARLEPSGLCWLPWDSTGVTAYGMEQRTNEIGVRKALGANRGKVVRMVLRAAFWQVGTGVALGILAAMGAGWVIASQLFGVQP
jgi:putative ABC transport system permease protein